MYGPQFFDYKFTYTQTFLWSEPFFQVAEGRRWGICSADGGSLRSSRPAAARRCSLVTLNGNESFGETQNSGTYDGAVLAGKWTGGTTAIYNINVPNSASGAGINSNLANGGNNINMFSNPAAAFNAVPALHPGLRHQLRIERPDSRPVELEHGLNIAKDINLFRERVAATLSFHSSTCSITSF